jgi:hypothetical protein
MKRAGMIRYSPDEAIPGHSLGNPDRRMYRD